MLVVGDGEQQRRTMMVRANVQGDGERERCVVAVPFHGPRGPQSSNFASVHRRFNRDNGSSSLNAPGFVPGTSHTKKGGRITDVG